MNKAIISGSTGLVGRELARQLLDAGVEVLCLGRRSLSRAEISDVFGRETPYLPVSMKDILSLPDAARTFEWQAGNDCVFYHFAWSGHQRLTDGSFGEQMNNAIYAANAVKAAKKMGCRSFVNAGTIEESYVERYVGGRRDVPYRSTQTHYSLAKIAGRDMCRILAYLEKIDYIHTRLSVPLDLDLSVGNYIATTLRRIRNGEPYDAPVSDKLYDIISTRQAAMAYRRIGEVGRNKADYFIGSGHPTTLPRFFNAFAEQIAAPSDANPYHEDAPDPGMFANDPLAADTGYRPTAFLTDFQEYHGRIS